MKVDMHIETGDCGMGMPVIRSWQAMKKIIGWKYFTFNQFSSMSCSGYGSLVQVDWTKIIKHK